jgi:outer membrane protein assembly factor BamB
MKMHLHQWAGVIALITVTSTAFWGCAQHSTVGDPAVPRYEVDPLWTKAMPDNWIYGQVSSVAVDERDHVYVLHRPRTLHADEKGRTQNPPTNRCCLAAPPVVEYDSNGNVVRAWGGPAQNNEGYDWPAQEHGIHVDAQGNVWISGNHAKDHHLLKFTREGKFLLQIGKPGKSEGSNSPSQLGSPAAIESDAAANEIYVGDGYTNKRVIVFDATTGAYKRHWGAYGEKPVDGPLAKYDPKAVVSRSFANPVHCVRLSNDGLVYVCDRVNNRIQVFKKDGTYVKEFRVST